MIVNNTKYDQEDCVKLTQFCPIKLGGIEFYVLFPLKQSESIKIDFDFYKLFDIINNVSFIIIIIIDNKKY